MVFREPAKVAVYEDACGEIEVLEVEDKTASLQRCGYVKPRANEVPVREAHLRSHSVAVVGHLVAVPGQCLQIGQFGCGLQARFIRHVILVPSRRGPPAVEYGFHSLGRSIAGVHGKDVLGRFTVRLILKRIVRLPFAVGAKRIWRDADRIEHMQDASRTFVAAGIDLPIRVVPGLEAMLSGRQIDLPQANPSQFVPRLQGLDVRRRRVSRAELPRPAVDPPLKIAPNPLVANPGPDVLLIGLVSGEVVREDESHFRQEFLRITTREIHV